MECGRQDARFPASWLLRDSHGVCLETLIEADRWKRDFQRSCVARLTIRKYCTVHDAKVTSGGQVVDTKTGPITKITAPPKQIGHGGAESSEQRAASSEWMWVWVWVWGLKPCYARPRDPKRASSPLGMHILGTLASSSQKGPSDTQGRLSSPLCLSILALVEVCVGRQKRKDIFASKLRMWERAAEDVDLSESRLYENHRPRGAVVFERRK